MLLTACVSVIIVFCGVTYGLCYGYRSVLRHYLRLVFRLSECFTVLLTACVYVIGVFYGVTYGLCFGYRSVLRCYLRLVFRLSECFTVLLTACVSVMGVFCCVTYGLFRVYWIVSTVINGHLTVSIRIIKPSVTINYSTDDYVINWIKTNT